MWKLEDLFGVEKPVIGRVELVGRSRSERIAGALEKVRIYEEAGVSGVIIEYDGCCLEEISFVMKAIARSDFGIVSGVNFSMRPGMSPVVLNEYRGKLVQFDSVQGDMFSPNWLIPSQFVLGGVGFEGQPKSGNLLSYDLREAMGRCDAIVTPGDVAENETPDEKLIRYKQILGDFPLIVRTDVDSENVSEQVRIANGAIIGDCFMYGGDARELLRGFMDVVYDARKDARK